MKREGMPGFHGVEHYGYGGDFEDPIHDAQFCINGLMFPDRTAHPSISELRYLQAPLQIELQAVQSYEGNGGAGLRIRVAVHNCYDFQTLGHLRFEARVVAGGIIVPLDGSQPDAAVSVHVRCTYCQRALLRACARSRMSTCVLYSSTSCVSCHVLPRHRSRFVHLRAFVLHINPFPTKSYA